MTFKKTISFPVVLVWRYLHSIFYPLYLSSRYSFYLGLPSSIRIFSHKSFSISPSAVIDSNSEIVIGFSNNSLSAMHLLIEDHVIIGQYCNIRATHGCIHIKSGAHLAQFVSLVAANHSTSLNDTVNWDIHELSKIGIVIGRNAWIGANVVILPGTCIGDNSVIGAGSIVTRSIPSFQVWAGNPAKFIKNIC